MIRPAVPGDSEAVRHLRNQADSRFWSCVPRIIGKEEHDDWFMAALQNPKHVILVEAEKAGIVAYARSEDITRRWVSFAVDRGARGQGVGTRLLRGLEYVAELQKVSRLNARVLQGNYPSLQAFGNAGYRILPEWNGEYILEKGM